MELFGKKVVVVGLGKSGVAAAKLCVAQGAQVLGTDSAVQEKVLPEVFGLGVPLVLGGHEGVDFLAADLVVVSPGVPEFQALQVAERAGVEVIGELELATRFATAPILVVGGTNGKSTTVTLLADLLQAFGKRAFLGGNLGTPASELTNGAWDYVVLEVSSFQAERVPQLKPSVSVLLNITDDHLDRYASFEAYAHAKGNVFVNQSAEDVAIIPFGHKLCLEQANRGRARVVTFGFNADYAVHGRSIVETRTGESFSLEKSSLFGAPNLLNAAAAIAAARALGVSAQAIADGLLAFTPLAHRMCFVTEFRGVRYYDDSKATNVGAAVTALSGMEEPWTVLIAGGRDKLGSYAPLVRALEKKGRAAIVIGEAKEVLKQAIGSVVPVWEAASMYEAVTLAAKAAEVGDAVLLSPACSSFDMFKSYAERGDCFQDAIFGLREGKKA